MPEKYRRNFLKEKEAKTMLKKAKEKANIDVEQMIMTKANIELVETDFAKIFLANGKPILAEMGENFFPTLVFNEFFASASKVVVDMGAVPHVCKGANIMRPGIRHFEGEFRKGDFVFVVDERHGKPLAVGEMLLDKGEAEKATHGVIVRNVHFVGDRLWNLFKQLAA
jgi:PUA domain protein